MRNESAAPAGETLHELRASIELEEDRYYQAALLDAPDLWLWDMFLAPSVKVFPFSLNSLASSGSEAKLETGSFAELLAIYHLFGDPALELR